MKANSSLYNAIFNIWMFSVYPSRQISVTSVGWWTSSCHLPSWFALKTIPFCCKIVVTLCPSSVVHASIRCIKSDVACAFRNNCRRKALGFLRLFRSGYFKERRVKRWPILPDTMNTERIISQEMWPASRFTFQSVASISLLFICTDCQRDFVRNRAPPHMIQMKEICICEAASHRESSCL